MNADQIRSLAAFVVGVGAAFGFARQCRKPRWILGRFVLASMNAGHSALTKWGLRHLPIEPRSRVLDVGCGGGQTIAAISEIAIGGRISGVDYSAQSVAATKRNNAGRIAEGRVDVQQASVSNLPFPAATFDIVTASETHYYWPNLRTDVQEILRVLKPGGTLMILAETYKGRSFDWVFRPVMTGLLGATYLTVDEHRDLLTDAGFSDVRVSVEPSKGWICALGQRPNGLVAPQYAAPLNDGG